MTTFLVSPPTRKPTVEKSEKSEESIPRLILAPFSPQAEVRFGEVTINSVQWKPLMIFNPSISMTIQFTNINPDDRISLSESKIQVDSRGEKQVLISWSPLQSGYLRKVIRAQDSVRKAKSFDVVLSGMAVNKGLQNPKKRKFKSETNTTQTSQRCSNITMTINNTASQKVPDFRRETFSIEEKENQLPIPSNPKKPPIRSSSPTTDCNYLNVLNENSITTNFSHYSSYDCVDAPAKYSNFESEFSGSRRTSVNSNLRDEADLRRSTFSIDAKNHVLSPTKNFFCDSLEEERSSTPTENVCEITDDGVKMTPLKIRGESFLFSPQDNQQTVTSNNTNHNTKSLSGFSIIEEGSFVSNFSFKPNFRDDVLDISPPAKCMKPDRKLNGFIHRTESSAIKDRRKHLRSSVMSKKKLSPKKILGKARSTTLNATTVERIRSQNPQALKQVVSQGPMEDPFLSQLLYSDDRWLDDQEKDIIKWMNAILVPVDLNEEQADWTMDGAEAWIKRNYSSNSVLAANKVPITLYTASEKLNNMRERKKALMESDFVKAVFSELSTQVARKIIFVRDGRDIYADESIKTKLLRLLGCYNPIWLRMGLEAVYEQEIALHPKADFAGLGIFIRKKVIVTSSFVKKTEPEREATRKMILLKFLQLIFFMDQARIQKVIRQNRCLFNLNSKHKASQDLLADFCADLVTGKGYVMKHLKNIGYVLQFKQTCIDEYDYTITSLKDLNDGVRLARLFEILFSEPGLCAKLRVPAIDIENKKFNIEVAMRVAKARFTIKGNITAEDFVLVTRLGSRLKILSFLWQIIYNYLTPLYEKAAIKIQKWWRKNFKRTKMIRLQDQEKRNQSAQIIQRAWRKHCFRTHVGQLVSHLRNQRLKEQESAIVIQRRLRARNEMIHQRTAFLRLKDAATKIQRRYRARAAMRKERETFTRLKQCAILIQRKYRRLQLVKTERESYLRLKNAAVVIQRHFRARKLAQSKRNKFVQIKRAVVKIQRSFRNYRLTSRTRNEFLTLKKCAIFVQRTYRAKMAMRECRNNYLRVMASVLTIQKWYRNVRTGKATRAEYSRLRVSVVQIQRRYRANQLMKLERRRYMRLRWAAVEIQRQFRSREAVKAERKRYLELKSAALLIQRRFRAKRLAVAVRNEFMRLKNCALAIQRRYRATILMRADRRSFLALKLSAILVQRRYRAIILMRADRHSFLALTLSAIVVQRRYRTQLLMRAQREEYENIRSSTIRVQRRFRAGQLMRAQRRRFLELRTAAIILQRQWRMKAARNRFLRAREAATEIQRWWSRIQARKAEQRDQQIIREAIPVKPVEELAAIKIQALWRGYRIRKMALVPKRRCSDSKSTVPQSTLGERYRKAIDQIKNTDFYNVIFNALWNLERVTTFSAKLCESVAAEGIVPIVFGLINRGNRSEPSLELYRSSISILINLTLYRPTKSILWDSLDKAEDVAQIVHLMKVTHDKFSRKNDSDVFRYSATFLWLLCQDEAIAMCVASFPFVKFHLEKMKNELERKCPCRKNNKGKAVRKMLPKTETNWYADAKTRTFDDHCFAILNLYDSLYHRS